MTALGSTRTAAADDARYNREVDALAVKARQASSRRVARDKGASVVGSRTIAYASVPE